MPACRGPVALPRNPCRWWQAMKLSVAMRCVCHAAIMMVSSWAIALARRACPGHPSDKSRGSLVTRLHKKDRLSDGLVIARQAGGRWSWQRESNPQPIAYEAIALPLSHASMNEHMERVTGFEPA